MSDAEQTPGKREIPPAKLAIGCGLLIAAVAAVAFVISVIAAGEKAPPPPVSVSAVRDVRAVSVSAGYMTVDVHIPAAMDGAHFVSQAAATAAAVGKAIQAGAKEDAPPLDRLLIRYSVPGNDRLGNDVQVGLMNVEFAAADLRQAKFAKLSDARVLGLATDVNVTSSSGRGAITSWCGDADNLDAARAFCGDAID